MRTYHCRCGGTLFFHSMKCVACGATTAVCPRCSSVTSLTHRSGGASVCDHCGANLRLCNNRIRYAACNRGVWQPADGNLCRYCALNRVIPDLSVAENLEKWKRMERAKHRVLHDVDRLGLPLITDRTGPGPRLAFRFPAAIGEPAITGHANGLITINIDEADSAHRERTRVKFAEPHRTLVGHFRHELGHYFWEVCVKPNCLDAFRETFGDERNPNYQDAKRRYYEAPARSDWQANHVSRYATMHPWEDFAETFNAYLDMNAIVATATHFNRLRVEVDQSDFEQLFTTYTEVGIVANELNRDMGLLDLVPEVFTTPVRQKLEFVHNLRERSETGS